MKKWIILCIFLVAVSASLAVVSANSLPVGGIDFTIPDGYQMDDSFGGVDSEGVIRAAGFDNGDDRIEISVSNTKTVDDYKDDTFSDKTIGDISGFIGEEDNGVVFVYEQDGQAVKILAPDEDTVKTIIGA